MNILERIFLLGKTYKTIRKKKNKKILCLLVPEWSLHSLFILNKKEAFNEKWYKGLSVEKNENRKKGIASLAYAFGYFSLTAK